MPIIKKSDEIMRSSVKGYLSEKRRQNPQYRVIDVGGARDPWCDEYVDAYVDIKGVNTSKHVFTGDINEEDVWERVSRQAWDFSICTHTLEDIRRPDFVLHNLMKHSRAGFIAVPTKHTELSSIRSHLYVGYCHHRWVFTLRDDGCLLIIAKWPGTCYFARSNGLFRLLGCTPLLSMIGRGLGFRPGGRGLPWLNRKKANPRSSELGFIWEGSFPFRFINDDYAGDNEVDMLDLYRNELREGL